MPKHPYSLLILFLALSLHGTGQTISGIVTDTAGKPLAFSTIKLGNTKQGLMADLKGKFEVKMNGSYSFITVSHLGYATQKIELAGNKDEHFFISLVPAPANLGEVVVKSTASKIRRILGAALANRNRNNPDKYDWYQCHIYYKTIVDGGPDSSILLADSVDLTKYNEWKESQHFFITETSSRRTWERPQKLQEEVFGSRIAGFKKAWFSSLVTDVLPFHAYNDFINFNGRDYNNPLSPGLYQRFDFRLEDEILQGKDTIWHISFVPKKNTEHLSGSLFISSNLFAITNLLASHYDPELKRAVGVEQQYSFEAGKWFPRQLNYYIKWEKLMGQPIELSMTGTSLIDSVSFDKNEKFRFDKAHTTRLLPGADELSDTAWKSLRPAPLSKKEHRTYEVIDSIGNKENFDRLPLILEKLASGYFPAGKVDIDLQRIYSYNKYENHRLGFGLRTSDKISKRFSLGGWFGYGTGDHQWKYGATAEVYADKYKEFTFRFSYKKDLQDPGRLQVNPELDKNFLRRFLLGRVDNIASYVIEVNKRMGYWQAGIGFSAEKITPQYTYALEHSGKSWNSFKAKEIILNLRYAYAERMHPMLGKYYSAGTKYPVLYSRIRFGEIENDRNRYLQVVGAVKWQTHINRWGKEQFLLLAGSTISKSPLPISKLFAGNGFLMDNVALYVFGGMQTIMPYEYYAERFVNFYWKHDFDFKLYNLKISRNYSSMPSLSIGYNVLWGKLKDASAHKFVQFTVPDPAYHEAGLILNRMLRMKFLSLYYLTFNTGYYYHLDGKFDHQKNGRFVFGLGVDL